MSGVSYGITAGVPVLVLEDRSQGYCQIYPTRFGIVAKNHPVCNGSSAEIEKL